jgi:2-(1,2-epoxy-1,2-dihydrophenyl)acetyl-CoA isomerase
MIEQRIQDGVSIITLNRPEKYNAIIREMALKIQQHLDEAANKEDIRAVLISAKGKAFCAGQDLQEVIEDNQIDITKIISQHYNPIIIKLTELEKPVICAVNGVAAGAGANLALACDIVVAGESASFIQAFSKIGLIPDSGGTYILPRLIGMQRAKAIMMLGDKISAKDAVDMGMIYKVFQDETLEAEALKLASKLASMPTKALGMTKRALNYGLTHNLDKQLGIEEQFQAAASMTEDFREGVNAFLEKRRADFKGK